MKIQFGEKLKEARAKAGLTLQQLADLVGAKRKQVVSSWEHGTGHPNLEMLELLAQHLNVPIEYFFDFPGKSGEVFVSSDGQEVLLDQDDPLRESFHQAQEQFETGELGAKVTVQMVVGAAKDREAFFESHPYMKAYWTLMYKLATEHPDVSHLLSGAKLANERVKIIADAIRAVIPRRG
jgi:transcriptional regulator with XRE-family HTH domain